jgi:hypothetical protein
MMLSWNFYRQLTSPNAVIGFFEPGELQNLRLPVK